MREGWSLGFLTVLLLLGSNMLAAGFDAPDVTQAGNPSSFEDPGSVATRPSRLSSGESEIVVKASGTTAAEAREQAIRAALASTVEQLVITDRLVRNGELVVNEVLSTQNGFITEFEVIEHYLRPAGEIEITARVRVSADTIVNFLAFRYGRDSRVDGLSILAEMQRRSENMDVLSQMLDRFLAGYPWDVVSLELNEVYPIPGRSDRMVASVRAKTEPSTILALADFLDAVSVLTYEGSGVRVQTTIQAPQVERVIFAAENPYWTFDRYGSNFSVPAEHAAVQYCMVTQRSGAESLPSSESLRLDAQGLMRPTCYLMPEGAIRPASWHTENGSGPGSQSDGSRERLSHGLATGTNLMFLITFLDGSGRSTVQAVSPDLGGCLLVPVPLYLLTTEFEGTQTHGFAVTEQKFRYSPAFGIPFRVGELVSNSRRASTVFLADVDAFFSVTLPVSSVDLARTRSFRGRAVFLDKTYPETELVQFIGEAPVKPEALCAELLDE